MTSEPIQYPEDEERAVFDFVISGFLKQQDRSYTGSTCRYRQKLTGAKCAAGLLVPDHDYNPQWEGGTVETIAYFREHYPNSLDLVGALQALHDEASTFRGMMIDYQTEYENMFGEKHPELEAYLQNAS